MAELGGLIEGGRVGASKTPNLSQGNNNFRSNVWSVVGPGGRLCQVPSKKAIDQSSRSGKKSLVPILLNISALPCLIECPIST